MNKNINIIFLAIDALRAKNLSCYGNKRNISPNIDNLAKKGILFEDAYSCINHTDPSFTTIFSGKYPLSHGIINHGPRVTDIEVKTFNERKIKLLPEILKENGYKTLAIDWLWRWHKRGYDYYSGAKPQLSLHGFLKQQFRKFPLLRKLIRQSMVDKLQEKVFKGVSKAYEDARYVTDHAIKVIKENSGEKIFLFLHYWDTHAPYLPPKEYIDNYGRTKKRIEELFRYFTSTRFKEEFEVFEKSVLEYKSAIISSYDGEISFIDHEIGRLIDFLQTQGIMNNTMIILTSDHGESLIEHGIYLDHIGLYDETIHVPLILIHPELPEDKHIQGFVQHFDIVPTILEILGIESNISFDGKSVLSLINGSQLHSAIYAEEAQYQRKRTIRTKNWKYIHLLSQKDEICRRCGRIHGAREELYDLTKDPKEVNNIIEKEPEIAVTLKKRLDNWIEKYNYQEPTIETTAETYKEDMDKVEDRLKGLGYI